MSAAPVLGFRVTTYNWRLRRAREAAGLKQGELADLVGCPMQRIQRIETLLASPRPDEALRIALALDAPVEHLFPEVLEQIRRTGKGAIDIPMGEETVRALANGAQARAGLDAAEEHIFQGELAAVLGTALAQLSPREREVLELRCGFDGSEPRTLQETGNALHLTPERIRQIEAKGLTKLRHPSRSKALRPFFSEMVST